jgi:thiamine biosynthesis lipoprotein
MIFHHEVFQAMASECEIQLYAQDIALARFAASRAIGEVRRIEQRYSRYRPDSVVSRINRMAGLGPVSVDRETALLLGHASACHEISQGLFDITSGVLRKVWDFRLGVVPTEAALAAVLSLVGWRKVEWDGSEIRLPAPGMEIDFGGIGKEYAVDRASAMLHSSGIVHAIVNLGGDVRSLGPHADGTPWDIHIADPRRAGAMVTTLKLARGALTTSGDYQRFFEFEGKRYCHILNPKTGMPVVAWQSATVISALCLDAGSIGTIAMLLEADALEFLDTREERYLLIDSSGGLHSHGLESFQRPFVASP